jgi:hypothetical protein
MHVTRAIAETPARAGAKTKPLVETVVHLTEWPTVLYGSFEPEYLALPEEVLVTVMRDHQKYFAVEDAQGKLAPHFLTVLNTQVDERAARSFATAMSACCARASKTRSSSGTSIRRFRWSSAWKAEKCHLPEGAWQLLLEDGSRICAW